LGLGSKKGEVKESIEFTLEQRLSSKRCGTISDFGIRTSCFEPALACDKVSPALSKFNRNLQLYKVEIRIPKSEIDSVLLF